MRPVSRFRNLPRRFWADVRLISQVVGYTDRRTRGIKVPTLDELLAAYHQLSLSTEHIIQNSQPTPYGRKLLTYFSHRAKVLQDYVEPRLMDAEDARRLYESIRQSYSPRCPLPTNKQKGKKKAPAYLTCMVNMLIDRAIGNSDCDFDPRALTIFTHKNRPVRTLARRVDGAFPSVVNPIAIWEIKEYYYTTTFGSRVADAIYESLLDGLELWEARTNERIHVLHYLIVDSHYTWWGCGKSYLCRIVDLLHMGLLDEVLFGREIVERLPKIVQDWLRLLRKRESSEFHQL